MSKSKGNIVDPEALIAQYGADTVRLFITFASPPEQSLEWSDSGVEGAYRFLKRLWQVCARHEIVKEMNLAIQKGLEFKNDWSTATTVQRDRRRKLYEFLSQTRFDYERSQFNTVVSTAMKCLNLIGEIPEDAIDPTDHAFLYESISILLRILAPVVPHITQELWRKLAFGDSILQVAMPKVNKEALKVSTIEYVVQVNGKLRGHIYVDANADQKTIEDIALTDETIARFTNDKVLKKAVVVPARQLVNLVVTDKNG